MTGSEFDGRGSELRDLSTGPSSIVIGGEVVFIFLSLRRKGRREEKRRDIEDVGVAAARRSRDEGERERSTCRDKYSAQERTPQVSVREHKVHWYWP